MSLQTAPATRPAGENDDDAARARWSPRPGGWWPARLGRSRVVTMGVPLAALLLTGCLSVRPLPEADLSDPAWTLWSGQALWKPNAARPPVAGEIVIARHANGDTLISFSKPPLPLFTAQTSGKFWRLDAADRRRAYGGKGRPPSRIIWFRLPDILEGAPPPSDWTVTVTPPDEWRLHDRKTGEAITLVLDP